MPITLEHVEEARRLGFVPARDRAGRVIFAEETLARDLEAAGQLAVIVVDDPAPAVAAAA